MSKRHDQAIQIQEGACNLGAIARTLVQAIDEARDEQQDPGKDPAVRLILHQMAFLANVGDTTDFPDYTKCMTDCEALSPRVQADKEFFTKLTEFLEPKVEITFTNQGLYEVDFRHVLDDQYRVEGTISSRYSSISLKFHALWYQDGEWKPTGFGFCGDIRQTARDYVAGLRDEISKEMDKFVGVIATDDPGLF